MANSTVTSPFTKSELEELRQRFPHTKNNRLYLNHAAIGPLSTDVIEAIQKRLKQRSSGRIDVFDRDAGVSEMARRYIGNLIHASSEDRIAFISNTSEGLNLIARGLQWEAGDHILINDLEFPANVYPYKKLADQGVEVEQVESVNGHISVDRIAESIRDSTRMVAISAVQFLNGFRADLKAMGELCNKHGCLFIVDGIQGLGVIPIDVQEFNIDALVSGSHKWLMGPQGIGFVYLTEQLQEQIVDHAVGWLSVAEPWHFYKTDQSLDHTARRYELGTPNSNGIYGLNASLESLHNIGIQRISQQIRMLTQRLLDALEKWEYISIETPRNWKERAGIVTIRLPEKIDNAEFIESLQGRGLTIALRENCLRFSPHYYNTVQEVDQSLNIVREILGKELG